MSFRLKTILGIATIEAILLAILIFNTLNYLRDSNEKQLLERVSTASQLFATATKDAVISYDLATLDSILETVMGNPGVAYAKILDQDNRILAQKGKPKILSRYFKENFSSDSVTDGIFDTQQIIEESEIIYGRVQIGFNITELQTTLQEAQRNSIAIAIIEMFLVALFSTFLGIYLTRQLIRLTEASQTVASGNLGYQLKVEGDDEIASTLRAFNHMSAEIKLYVDTIQETQKELVAAKHEAERANEAKTNFLSNMSHELRTPLNAVIGFSEILTLQANKETDPDTHLALNEIHNAGKHLLSLVNQILDLATIDAGQKKLDLIPIPLNDIIEQTLEVVSPLKVNFNVSVTYNNPYPQLEVIAHADSLKQSLQHLFSNAIQYNKQDGSVDVNVLLTDNNLCQIEIRDTGIGISEQQMEDLFKPFFRANELDYGRQGTGIGLSVTSKLIELMKGKLTASSVLNEGSVFTVYLELAEQPATIADEDKPALEAEDTVSHDRHALQPDQNIINEVISEPGNISVKEDMNTKTESGKLIAYVEDNPANLRLVEKLIGRKEGYELKSAVTGLEGIDLCVSSKPDLILLDINLPDINGMQILEKLKNEHGITQTPCIAITANAMKSDIEQFKEAGFDEILTKPINVNEFYSTLEKFIPLP